MTRLQEVFITNLRNRRKTTGLTQEQLAERCGISVNHLAAIESGRRFPSPESFQSLADGLGLEPFQLLVDPSSSVTPEETVVLDRYTEFLKDGLADQLKAFRERSK